MNYIPPSRIFTEEEIKLINKLYYDGVKLSEIRKQLKCGKQVLDRFLHKNGYERELVNGMQKSEEQFLSDLYAIDKNIIVLGKYVNCKTKILVKCKIDGFEWDVTPDNLLQGRGCPICNHRRTVTGYNDMWTTDPELARLLANPGDGYNYSRMTNTKLQWKCPNCGEIVESFPNAIISNGYRVCCPICSDSISFPEKLTLLLLRQLGVNYKFQFDPDWAKPKRYDFYLKDFNVIIETNGMQHYSESTFSYLGSRTLEQEQMNDEYKYNLAIKNGIKDIIYIDCRYSSIEYIKKSFEQNDKINSILQLCKIDWDQLENDLYKPIIVSVCELYESNDNYKDIQNLSKYFDLSLQTIKKYLIIGYRHGLCSFDNQQYEKDKKLKSLIKVYELDENMNVIKLWNSLNEIVEYYGFSKSCLYRQIKGYRNGSHKYKGRYWFQEQDYNNLIKNK